jgi:glycerophosphoryl diester phosphodiesterase
VVWTVNEPDAIARMIHMGVDGIISDYPDRVRDAAGSAPSGTSPRNAP